MLVIRKEGTHDADAIRRVHRAAFGGADPVEVGLVDALRADVGWLPHLSLVAVRDGAVVGHVVATRAWVGDVPALAAAISASFKRPAAPPALAARAHDFSDGHTLPGYLEVLLPEGAGGPVHA